MEAFRRGVGNRCPRCGRKGLFATAYRLHRDCPDCGLPLEHEDGWALGAIPLNYSLTCLGWVLPVAIIFILGGFSLKTAAIIGGAGAVILPFLTYRYSKKVWVGLYYAILPRELRVRAEGEKGDIHG